MEDLKFCEDNELNLDIFNLILEDYEEKINDGHHYEDMVVVSFDNIFANTYQLMLENGKKEHISKHTLTAWMKDWVTFYMNSSQMLCSHILFYSTFDGSSWYTGYAHSGTTYDNKQTVQDISKGDTEFEAMIGAMNYTIPFYKARLEKKEKECQD